MERSGCVLQAPCGRHGRLGQELFFPAVCINLLSDEAYQFDWSHEPLERGAARASVLNAWYMGSKQLEKTYQEKRLRLRSRSATRCA